MRKEIGNELIKGWIENTIDQTSSPDKFEVVKEMMLRH